jgi:hypothetical protein
MALFHVIGHDHYGSYVRAAWGVFVVTDRRLHGMAFPHLPFDPQRLGPAEHVCLLWPELERQARLKFLGKAFWSDGLVHLIEGGDEPAIAA